MRSHISQDPFHLSQAEGLPTCLVEDRLSLSKLNTASHATLKAIASGENHLSNSATSDSIVIFISRFI